MSPGQAKEELLSLNDRLAVYIKKIRSLTEENNNLTIEISVMKKSQQTEVEQVRRWYEKELAEATKEKAQEQYENRKNGELADEYKKKLVKEIAAHKKTEDALKAARRKLADKEAQLVMVNQEVRNLEAEVQRLTIECQELRDARASAKYDLEQVTLVKVSLEKKLKSMEEELKTTKEIHEEEKVEIRAQWKSREAELKEHWIEKLEELREIYNNEIKQKKEEMDQRYIYEYDELKKKCAKYVEELKFVKEEKRKLSITVENLSSDLSKLQSKNASLVLTIEDLEKSQARANEVIDIRDVQIKELEKKLERVEAELKLEIRNYEKMLEEEEKRLNIRKRKRDKAGKGVAKRLRLDAGEATRKETVHEETEQGTTYSTQGYIQIKEANTDGKYVSLFNKSSKDLRLGGWTVERSVDGGSAIVYKFTPKYVLKSGSYVTIWASQSGGQHKPPTDLVFRQKASWGVGKETSTVLRDAKGKEAASVVSTVSIVRTDETDSRRVVTGQREEAASVVSEEVSIVRTHETDSHRVVTGERVEERIRSNGCIIQ